MQKTICDKFGAYVISVYDIALSEYLEAGLDNSGPMATGYPCWTKQGKCFSTLNEAQLFFYKNKEYLLRGENLDLETLCVRKIEKTVVRVLNVEDSLQDMLAKKQEEKERAEYERLKKKFERGV